MKVVGIIGTAVLSLTLGVAAPACAQQEQHDQQEEQKAKPAHQDEKKAQQAKPARQAEKATPQQDKNARQAEKATPQQDKNARQAEKATPRPQSTHQPKSEQQGQRAGSNGTGRIPDDRFRAKFGREHSFRVSRADYSNRRFQYGGYSFGFVDPWPSNWLYTQNVYVVDIDGVYYLCNPVYPGVNLALSFTL